MNDFKIGFFGSSKKTSVAYSFFNKNYNDDDLPLYAQNLVKTITIDRKKVNVRILDVNDQDLIGEMKYIYILGVQGYVFFYDATDQESFLNIKKLYEEIQDALNEDLCFIVAELNSELRYQKDQQKIVSKTDVQNLSVELKCPIIEVSALTGKNVNEIIKDLVREIIEKARKRTGEVDLKIGFFGSDGKTAVSLRFFNGILNDEYISDDFEEDLVKTINIDDMNVNISILDVSSQDSLGEMRYTYFSQVQGYVLFYDVSDSSSFLDMKKLYFDIKASIDDDFYCLIAELNSEVRQDNQRNNFVTKEEVQKLSVELNCPIIEVSAQTGKNVDEIIDALVKIILNKGQNQEIQIDDKIYKIVDNKKQAIEIKIGLFGSSEKTDIGKKFVNSKKRVFNFPGRKIKNEFSKVINVDDQNVELKILDIPEKNCTEEKKFSYISQVQGYILFFDISDPDSITSMKSLFSDIKNFIKGPFFVLIGGLHAELRESKLQKEQEKLIPLSDIKDISEELQCQIIEVSSQTGKNVDTLFTLLVRKILSQNEVKVGKYSANLKDDWNVSIIDVQNSDAEQLVRKFIFDDVSDSPFDDEYTKIVEADNLIVPLNLHLCQFGIDQPFFDKVQGVVFVFNIGETDSYEAVRRAVRQAKDEVSDELIGVIAANHGELRHTYNENLVEYTKLESLEDEFSVKVIEVSSVTNENIEELFFYVTKKMVQKMKKEKKKLEVQKRKKSDTKKKKH